MFCHTNYFGYHTNTIYNLKYIMDLTRSLLDKEEYSDFSSIVEGNEQIVRDRLTPIQFTPLSMGIRQQLVYDKSNLCEFHDALLENSETQFLYNTGNGQLYGACVCEYKMLDRLDIPGLPANVTSGRLLWAHILKSCYDKSGRRPFMVLNHSIDDASGYHIQMGMHTYSSSPVKDVFPPKRIEEIIDSIEGFEESYLGIGRTTPQIVASPKTTYLFYSSHPEINYGDIPSILNSIPLSARMGGKKSKKRRNKKSKRRNKK